MVIAVVPVCKADWLEVVEAWLLKTGLMNDVGAVDIAGWTKTVVPVVFAIGATVSTDEDPWPSTAPLVIGAAARGSDGTGVDCGGLCGVAAAATACALCIVPGSDDAWLEGDTSGAGDAMLGDSGTEAAAVVETACV